MQGKGKRGRGNLERPKGHISENENMVKEIRRNKEERVEIRRKRRTERSKRDSLKEQRRKGGRRKYGGMKDKY